MDIDNAQCLPEITLDTTLAELYSKGSQGADEKKNALPLCVADWEAAPTCRLARNTKYLYQDSTFTSTPSEVGPDEYDQLRRSVATKCLSPVPRRDAFAAGNMSVMLVELDHSEGASRRCKEEAERTMSGLTSCQRPTLLFVSDPSTISLEDDVIEVLAVRMEFDGLEGFPLATDLETRYGLDLAAIIGYAMMAGGQHWETL